MLPRGRALGVSWAEAVETDGWLGTGDGTEIEDWVVDEVHEPRVEERDGLDESALLDAVVDQGAGVRGTESDEQLVLSSDLES